MYRFFRKLSLMRIREKDRNVLLEQKQIKTKIGKELENPGKLCLENTLNLEHSSALVM